jgi:hypothetical protein
MDRTGLSSGRRVLEPTRALNRYRHRCSVIVQTSQIFVVGSCREGSRFGSASKPEVLKHATLVRAIPWYSDDEHSEEIV